MKQIRFAVIGAGFWARFQLSAWREAGGAACVAICNRTRSRAEELAHSFNIPAVYTDPDQMLAREQVDCVDIISAVEAHEEHVRLAAGRGIPVICQKPMAPSLEAARRMVALCRKARVPFFIHENWRWQAPVRALKKALDGGAIGAPFRGAVTMITGFPVFTNQPFLREIDQFILADLGSHLLDASRFLFGEAESLSCLVSRVHPDIKGEDVATVMMKSSRGVTVVVSMAYAENALEEDRFPETFILVEGSKGSVRLAADFTIRLTTMEGTTVQRFPPPSYGWVEPRYALVQASMVPCITDLARAVRGEAAAETTAEDNLKTMELVFASYESALSGKTVFLTPGSP